MIRAVVFDFYGTLARAVAQGPSQGEVLARRGFRLEEEAHAAWAAEVADGREHLEHSASRQAYRAWEQDRLRRLALACGVGEDDVDALVADLHQAAENFVLEAYDEVPEVLAQLRDRGLVLAVCSNWDWDLDRAVAQAGLDALLDPLVTSARAGARKPHPRIFEQTVERCGVEPRQALFVGDSWHPDVEGPLAFGFRPVHVLRPEEAASRPEPAPPLPEGVVRLPDLRGLPDLL